MKNNNKTKEQLIKELQELRQRIAEFETIEAQRKRAEQALQESEKKYKFLVDNSKEVILVISKKGKILFANNSTLSNYGYSREELIGRSIIRFLMKDCIKPVLYALAQEFLGHPQPEMEVQFKSKSGEKRYLNVAKGSTPIYEKGKWIGVMVSGRDITERKQAEMALSESEARYRGLIETARDIIFTLSTQGIFTSANRASATITGWPTEEWIGKPFTDLLDAGDIPFAMERFEALIAGRLGEPIEVHLRRKKGDTVPVELFAAPQIKDGKIIGVLGIARDITHRKQAEEEIRKSLKEKEVLLREIHHRVKNNMQVISSLLSLQADQVGDKAFREMLKASQSRIRSMALVHERLYMSQDFSHINFSDYVQSLAIHLFQFNQVNPDLIQLKMNLKDIFLDIQTAIPCGLILNELLMNSLKHAFPQGKGGEIAVELNPLAEHEFQMIVRDNGVGIPKDLDVQKTKSLGLQIITMLVDQLEGSLEVQREGGTTFMVVFKELKYKPRSYCQ